jgi:hypothetical protein
MSSASNSPGLSALQLSSLSIQAGAFAGAGAAGLSASSVNASGLTVFASLVLGFGAGALLGWVAARPVVKIVCPRLQSRRSQAMLVSAMACSTVAALAIVGFTHFSGEHVSLVQPLFAASAVALFFGVQGQAP